MRARAGVHRLSPRERMHCVVEAAAEAIREIERIATGDDWEDARTLQDRIDGMQFVLRKRSRSK
jgi:hypothetical protein